MSEQAKNVLGTIGSFVLILVAWDLVVRIFSIKPYLLPSPFAVLKTIAENWQLLGMHTLWTSGRLSRASSRRRWWRFRCAADRVSPLLRRCSTRRWWQRGDSSRSRGAALHRLVRLRRRAQVAVAVRSLSSRSSSTPRRPAQHRSRDGAARALDGCPPHASSCAALPNALPMIFGGLKVASRSPCRRPDRRIRRLGQAWATCWCRRRQPEHCAAVRHVVILSVLRCCFLCRGTRRAHTDSVARFAARAPVMIILGGEHMITG